MRYVVPQRETLKTPFLQPRLVGARYDEASVPLEALKEWAAMEELILEVARRLYLDDNPDRQRVPRGFAEGFSLHLSGVEPGSARPLIDRVSSDSADPGNSRYYEKARDIILAAILAAQLAAPLPPAFPRDLAVRFDRVGRSLREGESIEFPAAVAGQTAVLDQGSRKRLVLFGAKEYTSERILRGQVTERDAEKETFLFSLISGPRVLGNVTREMKPKIDAAFDGYRQTKQKVIMTAVTVFDQNDKPRRIDEVLGLEEIDALDVPARLEELRALRAGWLDGEGKQPSGEGLAWLAETWAAKYPADLPNPYAYPTPDGEIQLEWTLGPWEVSAVVNLETKNADAHALNVQSDVERVVAADLTSSPDWHTLSDFVRAIAREGNAA